MSDLWITCPIGNNVVWAYSFSEEEVTGTEIEIIEHVPTTEHIRPRVKAVNVRREDTKFANEKTD